MSFSSTGQGNGQADMAVQDCGTGLVMPHRRRLKMRADHSMMRFTSSVQLLLWGTLLLAGSATAAQAQWDPWLMGPRYQTSYYTPSFFNGYWGVGYAPAYTAGYGPATGCGCPCPSVCDPCGGCNSCGSGGCASGNCSMNSAPSGSMRPIPESERGNYTKDAPVPGRGSTGGRSTFDESDPGRFEEPNINSGRSGTGSGTGTGTGTSPLDDYRPRPGDTDRKKPFEANKPELGDPVLPDVPGSKAPAAPADVKEEAPVDAALDLDTKITSGPVLMRDRLVSRTRGVSSNIVRTPARPAFDWSAVPSPTRIVRK